MGTTVIIQVRCDHCKRMIEEIVDGEVVEPSIAVVRPYSSEGGNLKKRPYIVCDDCEAKLFGDAEVDA